MISAGSLGLGAAACCRVKRAPVLTAACGAVRPAGSESSLGDAAMPDAYEAAGVGALSLAQFRANPAMEDTRRSEPARENMKRSEMGYNILRQIGISPYHGKLTRGDLFGANAAKS